MHAVQCGSCAAGDLEGGLRLWDAARLECANELAGHAAGITCVTFARDLRRGCAVLMASADAVGTVIVWALDLDGSVLESSTLRAHGNRVVAMRFVAGGRKLVTASVDTSVAVWSVGRAAQEARVEAHKRAVTAMDTLAIKGARRAVGCLLAFRCIAAMSLANCASNRSAT